MILLTVGTQLPFDRLVRLVDDLASVYQLDVTAQIGHAKYEPKHLNWSAMISPVAFEAAVARCDRIVSHAGIGTIVTAQRHRKPLIVFARLGSLKEHRNDHQLATIAALKDRAGIYVARDRDDLERLLLRPLPPPDPAIDPPQRLALREAITADIQAEKKRRGF